MKWPQRYCLRVLTNTRPGDDWAGFRAEWAPAPFFDPENLPSGWITRDP